MNQGNWMWSSRRWQVNIDFLGISELKWTGMGKFNSDDHYIYYCGQEILRRNGVALKVNKRVQNAVLQRDLCSFPRQTIQRHSNPTLCHDHWCQRRWTWRVLWRSTTPSRITARKRCPFHHRGLESKSGKSRDTWSNRQVWPWSTKWSRPKNFVKRTCWS